MTVDPPRAAYAFNGDATIAYGVVGDDPVDLVYVQGFVSHVELMWECPQAVAFFERIAEWARLIIVDRRGTGMSDRFGADQLPPLEDAALDVVAVMDAVGSARASFLGHHEGGRLVAMLAALHPDRVRTLSLFETAINWRRAVERTEGRTYTDADIADLTETWRTTYGIIAEEQQLYAITSPSHAGDRELFRFFSRLQRFAASPNSAVGFLRLLFETDIGGVLGAISAPRRSCTASTTSCSRWSSVANWPRRSPVPSSWSFPAATGGRSSARPSRCWRRSSASCSARPRRHVLPRPPGG